MKSIRSRRVAAAILLAAAVASGCSTTGASVTYAFDPQFSFTEAKTYEWAKSKPLYASNALVEANVRFLTDRHLQAKGLNQAATNPALHAWIGYEPDYYPTYYTTTSGYQLRTLTINIARAGDGVVVWQGRAVGSIRTDAASGDLKSAVEGMLAHFPPK